MKLTLTYLLIFTLLFTSCGSKLRTDKTCQAKVLACKLTSPELRERKATVLAKLQREVLEKKELDNGYDFQFKGNDEQMAELKDFIISEKECCNFFDFALTRSADKSTCDLVLTGPTGTKQFIKTELGL